MATEDLHPTSDISVELTPWGGGANYDKVDEAYASRASGTGEEVYIEYQSSQSDEYGLSNTVSMGSGDETSQIEALIFAGWSDTDYRGELDARLYINGGYVTSAEGSVEIPDEYPGSWQTRTFTGVWTKAQVDAAQIEVTLSDPEQSSLDSISTVVVRVTYAAGGGASAAITGTITASVDEADIVSGGKTIIITLTDDTWIPNP